METLISKLLEQSPIIIVLCVVGYIMWSYIKEKNSVISKKDQLLAEQTNKMMDLYGKATESYTKLALAIDELRKDRHEK